MKLPALLVRTRPALASSVAALVLLARPVAAEPVTNPYPEKIAKGDITIEFQPVAKGLASPVLLVRAPDNSNRLFIVDQAGTIRVVENGQLRAEPFLDATDRMVKLNKDFDERGLLGLAFDPDFEKAGSPGYRRLFTYLSEPAVEKTDFKIAYGNEAPNCQAVIASYKVAADGQRVDPSTRRELLRIDKPQFNHNGGMITFGPDRFLYISLGDGGGGNDLGPGHNPKTGNGQDKTVPLGKMLRIDVNGSDSANGAYGIPKDNPFVAGGGLKEIYAYGLRNPWRFSFDGATLLVGDVGQAKLEYVYRVERGGNYGWRIKEGSFKFNTDGSIEKAGSDLPAGLIDPVLEFDHDEGTSVMGGYVYRGKAIPALSGQYVFGDYQKPGAGTGRLFYATVPNGKISEFRIGQDDRKLGFLLKGFGEDAQGEIYVCGSAKAGPVGEGGVVMKIVPVGK